MKLFLRFLIMILIIGVSQGQENEKLRIAILDFSNTGGLSQQETVTLTNRLRSMLVQTKAFIVLERGAMDEILDEQGFQQTGCTTTECAVELGKMLNVQKMVSGSIGKLGQTYTIDLSLIDVGTAQIEKSFMRNYKGEIDGLLELMERVSNEVASIGKTKQQEKPEKKIFTLKINSNPEEATVLVNEKEIGETPLERKFVEGNNFTVKLKKENYALWESAVLIDDNKEINAKLEFSEAYKQVLAKKVAEDAKKESEPEVQTAGSSGGNTWYYIAGGAVVAGGLAYLILSGSDDKDEPEPLFPDPIGRPN